MALWEQQEVLRCTALVHQYVGMAAMQVPAAHSGRISWADLAVNIALREQREVLRCTTLVHQYVGTAVLQELAAHLDTAFVPCTRPRTPEKSVLLPVDAQALLKKQGCARLKRCSDFPCNRLTSYSNLANHTAGYRVDTFINN